MNMNIIGDTFFFNLQWDDTLWLLNLKRKIRFQFAVFCCCCCCCLDELLVDSYCYVCLIWAEMVGSYNF